MRERLALLGKTLFLVSFGFYLFLLASPRGMPHLAAYRPLGQIPCNQPNS